MWLRAGVGLSHPSPVVAQIGPGIEEYVMNKLQGDTTYKSICLKAFNADEGFRGPPSNVLDDIHTLVPTRLQVVEDEIRLAEESKYEFIDSVVLMGFKQRYHREELIEKLQVEAEVRSTTVRHLRNRYF